MSYRSDGSFVVIPGMSRPADASGQQNTGSSAGSFFGGTGSESASVRKGVGRGLRLSLMGIPGSELTTGNQFHGSPIAMAPVKMEDAAAEPTGALLAKETQARIAFCSEIGALENKFRPETPLPRHAVSENGRAVFGRGRELGRSFFDSCKKSRGNVEPDRKAISLDRNHDVGRSPVTSQRLSEKNGFSDGLPRNGYPMTDVEGWLANSKESDRTEWCHWCREPGHLKWNCPLRDGPRPWTYRDNIRKINTGAFLNHEDLARAKLHKTWRFEDQMLQAKRTQEDLTHQRRLDDLKHEAEQRKLAREVEDLKTKNTRTEHEEIVEKTLPERMYYARKGGRAF